MSPNLGVGSSLGSPCSLVVGGSVPGQLEGGSPMRGVVVVEEVPSRERPRSRHKGRKPSGGNAGEGGRSSKPPRCPPPLPRASVCCPPPVSVPGLFSGGGRVILCTNKHGPVGREVSSPSPGQFWGDPILAVTFPLPWHCVRPPPPLPEVHGLTQALPRFPAAPRGQDDQERDNFSCHGTGGVPAPPGCGDDRLRLTALPGNCLTRMASPSRVASPAGASSSPPSSGIPSFHCGVPR